MRAGGFHLQCNSPASPAAQFQSGNSQRGSFQSVQLFARALSGADLAGQPVDLFQFPHWAGDAYQPRGVVSPSVAGLWLSARAQAQVAGVRGDVCASGPLLGLDNSGTLPGQRSKGSADLLLYSAHYLQSGRWHGWASFHGCRSQSHTAYPAGRFLRLAALCGRYPGLGRELGGQIRPR